jgi:hypothetical protein
MASITFKSIKTWQIFMLTIWLIEKMYTHSKNCDVLALAVLIRNGGSCNAFSYCNCTLPFKTGMHTR